MFDQGTQSRLLHCWNVFLLFTMIKYCDFVCVLGARWLRGLIHWSVLPAGTCHTWPIFVCLFGWLVFFFSPWARTYLFKCSTVLRLPQDWFNLSSSKTKDKVPRYKILKSLFLFLYIFLRIGGRKCPVIVKYR